MPSPSEPSAPEHHQQPEELHNESDDGDALSPADGYFHNSNSLSQAAAFNVGDELNPVADGRHMRRGLSANVPHVPNVLVEDPSLRQSSADAKAQEAAEEASGSNTQNGHSLQDSTHDDSPSQPQPASASTAAAPTVATTVATTDEDQATRQAERSSAPSPSPSPPSSPRSPNPPRRLPSERTPLIRRRDHAHRVHEEAPPAYSRNPPTAYRTMSPGHLLDSDPLQRQTSPEEQEPLLSTDPQSMSTPFPDPDLPVSLVFWRRFSRVNDRPRLRKRIVLILAAVLVFVIVAIVTITYLMSNYPKHDYVEEPVKQPDDPNGVMRWNPLPNCRKSESSMITGKHSYTYNADQNFTILQVSSNEAGLPPGRPIHVFGDVIVRPDNGLSFSPGSIHVESIANAEQLGHMIDWDRDTHTYKITTPQEIPWDDRDLDPCVQLRITMFVPPGAVLHSLSLQTQDLNVKIQRGLVLGVVTMVDIMATSGDVIFPTKDANESLVPYRLENSVLAIQNINEKVRGWFPIYDQLVLATNGGTIVADVSQKVPKDRKGDASQLTIESLSGDVAISEVASDSYSDPAKFKLRDHKVEIRTDSGNINAETRYTSAVTIISQSGDIKLSAWPALGSYCLRWGYKFCSISTDTKSGASDIIFNPPPKLLDGVPGQENNTAGGHQYDAQYDVPSNISNYRSLHASLSGKITANYSDAWQGRVVASTLTGDLSYRGKDLVMTRWDAVNKRLRGYKGDGNSVLVLSTMSGDQDVLVGKEEDPQ